MKIRELRTFVVANPPPQWGGRYFLFLKLITDSGIEGVGEVYRGTVYLGRDGTLLSLPAQSSAIEHRELL